LIAGTGAAAVCYGVKLRGMAGAEGVLHAAEMATAACRRARW